MMFRILTLGIVLLSGCERFDSFHTATDQRGGDPARGRALMAQYGCVACHKIPGLRATDGRVGPPLAGMARRHYIAGRLPNTPENLARWILNPKSVDQQTIMPVTGVDRGQTLDIVAYLSILK